MRTEMTGGRVGGGGGGGGAAAAAIPPSSRKVVQNLKEIATGHGEEEIYAMLKDCNMDPNETAQRLMSQDTFHEVKRKKDRKKEVSSSAKEGSEGRSRGTGSYRGGRGGGRGVARYVSSDTNGRGRSGAPRENGSYPPNIPAAAESKPAPPPPPPQAHAQPGSSLSTGASAPLPNGSVHYASSTAPAQGSWSKIAGHATMADMLKSNNAMHQQQQQQHQQPLPLQFTSSGMYSSSDPVHHPFADQRAPGGISALKRDIGIVGVQRPIGDRGGLPSPPSQASNSQEEVRPISPPHEAGKSQDPSTATVVTSSGESLRQPAASRSGNGRPPYQPQTAAVNKTAGGINLEWKPKLGGQENDIVVPEALKFPSASVSHESEVLSKFSSLSTRDEHHQQVIMPNNFQSQSDLGLSFGSFGESFGSSIPSGFRSEDGIEVPESPETSVPAKDILHEQSSNGVDIAAEDDPVHHQDEIPAQRDSLASNTNASISAATYTSQADISKLRAQQAQQYSYLQSPPSYSSGIGMVSQIPSSQQHVFDSQESHLQDLPSAPTNLKQQHYADSGASFYSPAFRPSSDGDARYQYLPTNTTAKYTNGAVVMTGQQHLPQHEVATSTSLSSSSTASQSGNTHSMPTAPQQPVPVHAYPAQPTGVPVGHFGNVFGYQYPGYTFMPSPYQHSYTTSYPQPPVSSYSPSNYTPAGVAAVKYPVPQYKPGSATANAPLSAVTGGYGGYGTASSMYAGNPSATASNTPGYEDASGGQYKESNLYMHGPQGDGGRLWQLSNDVAAQTSSFYTLSGQNQHTSYTQQPSSHTHPMASYTSLYHHPSQQQQQQPGGPASTGHQMIQQPQTLSGAAGSTQVGAAAAYHQQLQRMQQPNWNAY